MTTLYTETKTCFVCGQASEQAMIGSTNEFGSPDLDLRPAEMRRSTIRYWVQRCPGCGYCASDLGGGPEIARMVVGTPLYEQVLNDRSFSELGQAFMALAMIREAAGDLVGAAWSTVHAAWSADDAGMTAVAMTCRSRAAERVARVRRGMSALVHGPGGDEALLADLLRRSGAFSRAATVCDEGLARKPGEPVRSVLLYQKELAQAGDLRRHTVAEALKKQESAAKPIPSEDESSLSEMVAGD